MEQNQPSTSARKSEHTNDGNVIVAGFKFLKTLDANRYATKKTIAQGLLDVALLTANASQLKYVLQVGKQHEFYTLMLSLIIVSIVLQLIVAILFVIIGGLNINKTRDHTAAVVLNDVILIFVFLISLTVLAVFCVILGSSLDINKEKDQDTANKTNNAVLCVNVLIVIVNVLASAFQMRADDIPSEKHS